MNTPNRRRYPEIANELSAYIAEKAFVIGDKLPAERELAEQFGVSRALLREALIMLEIQGIVEVRQGSGVYLQADGEPLHQHAEDDIGPFELLQARQVLESSIAEVAALTVTKRDIDDLQKILEQHTLKNQGKAVNEAADEQFHLRIAEATQNRVLEESVQALWEIRKRSPMWKKLHSHITHPTYWQQWTVDHQAVFTALKRKDARRARQAMWQHLDNVRKTVLALSDVDTPEFDGYLFQPLPLSGDKLQSSS